MAQTVDFGTDFIGYTVKTVRASTPENMCRYHGLGQKNRTYCLFKIVDNSSDYKTAK